MKMLAEALVEAAAFLELSGDDVVHPDAAVQAMESIVASLARASDAEKAAVLAYCRLRANEPSHDARRRDFYQGFGESFGLTDQ